ncbi:MAG: GldG family protein, partial [Verrucomicrobiaceae bacterium]|nr:GldG family protein [Verrucomicrobiaceae bacterium]
MAAENESLSTDNKSTTKSIAAPSWLYSFFGAIIVFALLVTVNIIASKLPGKLDLTEDKLHTLSEGTLEILDGLDAEVKISFFVSKDKDNMRPDLTLYSKRVDALLDEYVSKAKDGFLEIEHVDPQPESDEEDRAKLNNLQPDRGRLGEAAYLGITVSCLDRKSSIPFLNPGEEPMLEFEISRRILEVSREEAPKVAIMSALPVTGGPPAAPFNPQARQQQQPPWQFYTELRRDYDPDLTDGESNLVDLGLDVEEIAADIDVVVLVHPAGISENTQFALDQFLLRGGQVLAFLDAFSFVAAQSQPQQRQPFGGQQPGGIPTSSNLDKLLPAWGVNFESNQVLADMVFQGERFRAGPVAIGVTAKGIDNENPITNAIKNLEMFFAGVFYVDRKAGIKAETLVHSSASSQLVAAQAAQFGPEQLMTNFKASGKEYPLAVRLTGDFKTAFPEGKPKAAEE